MTNKISDMNRDLQDLYVKINVSYKKLQISEILD